MAAVPAEACTRTGHPETPMPNTATYNPDRIFFVTMTALAFAIVFVGFAPTFYLKEFFDTPPLKPLVHVHGVAFTLWPVLVVTQVLLIRRGNYALHRTLGTVGMIIVAVMVITGYMVIFGKPRPTEAARAFIFTPMLDLIIFPALVAAGIRFRRDAAKHKRLMYLATFFTVGAGMRRVLGLLGIEASMDMGWWPFSLGFTMLFVLLLAPLLIYDAVTLRRIHPVTLLGIGIVVARVPLHNAVSRTEEWQRIAHWLTNT
jgi:hypothetical protein